MVEQGAKSLKNTYCNGPEKLGGLSCIHGAEEFILVSGEMEEAVEVYGE